MDIKGGNSLVAVYFVLTALLDTNQRVAYPEAFRLTHYAGYPNELASVFKPKNEDPKERKMGQTLLPFGNPAKTFILSYRFILKSSDQPEYQPGITTPEEIASYYDETSLPVLLHGPDGRNTNLTLLPPVRAGREGYHAGKRRS